MLQFDRALIYEANGADPRTDRIERQSAGLTLTIVPVGALDQIVPVAKELAKQGVGLIELCGGLSPVVRAEVADALGTNVRVSSVMFGIDSIASAAAYNAAFLSGNPPPEAFLFLEEGADPKGDRFVRSFPPQRTTFVAVPNARAAAAVAAELAGDGFGLIELYGGLSLQDAANVIRAVDGRAPVGVGSFTIDQTSHWSGHAG